MSLSAAQICNLALGRIGHREPISSLEEDSEAARMAKVAFRPALEEVLSSFDWPFTHRSAVLNQLVETSTRSGWAYAYSLPTDCVRVLSLFNGARPGGAFVGPAGLGMDASRVYVATPTPFAVELSEDGARRVLVTDSSTATVEYVALVQSAALPPLVAQAFAWKLAMELALSLAGKPDIAQAFETKYQMALHLAMAQAANEEQGDVVPESSFVTVRGW